LINTLELNQSIALIEKDIAEMGQLHKDRTWVLLELIASVKWLLKDREEVDTPDAKVAVVSKKAVNTPKK
jgi:hypothetical protein